MANKKHANWLREGVESWNRRRKKVKFFPDLSAISFQDFLPPDFRDSPKTSRYFEKIDLSSANLSDSDLSDQNFSRAKFSQANLTGADLKLSNFKSADFTRANLAEADASMSHFQNCVFDNTNLKGSIFNNAVVDGAVFIATELPRELKLLTDFQNAIYFRSRTAYIEHNKHYGVSSRSSTISHKEDYLPERTEQIKNEITVDKRSRKNIYDVFLQLIENPYYSEANLSGLIHKSRQI